MFEIDKNQNIQSQWKKEVGLINIPWERELKKYMEEFWEVLIAIEELRNNDTPENRYILAEELGDNLIIILGFIESLGFNAQEIVENKFDINYQKYNPEEIRKILSEGHTIEEALIIQKSRWSGK